MKEHKFSKKEAISFGWETMKGNLGFFIGLLLIAGFISHAADIFKYSSRLLFPFSIFTPSHLFNAIGALKLIALIIYLLLTLISWILQIVMNLGFMKIGLGFCDRRKGQLADLFSSFPLFFKALGATILYALIIVAGLILLIVPGIIWGIKLQFFGYFIVEEKLGPVQALRRSAALTRGAKGDLFLFSILLILINLLGAICLLIGLFATIPTTMVARAFVYRKLRSNLDPDQAPEAAPAA